jgi:hypothetical protein
MPAAAVRRAGTPAPLKIPFGGLLMSAPAGIEDLPERSQGPMLDPFDTLPAD